MEGKVDQFKRPLISPEGVKDENNGTHWDPLRSILNFLLFNILVLIPLCFYDVYMNDGFFSRRFVDFALSAFLVVLIYTVASKVIGADNEKNPKKIKILGVSANLVLMLVNLILVPLRLHEVYLTDGIFSRRFAHFALCGFSLVLTHLGMSEIISSGTCMVLIFPVFISFAATLEWDLLFCVTLAGCLVFVIIIFYVLAMYEKGFDKKSDGEDVSGST